MTAEILSNALYLLNDDIMLKTNDKIITTYSLSKDFVGTIGCVIIDEIHFISDRGRGHVWENMLILLDKSVQIV